MFLLYSSYYERPSCFIHMPAEFFYYCMFIFDGRACALEIT